MNSKHLKKLLCLIVISLLVIVVGLLVVKQYKIYCVEYSIRQNMNNGNFVANIALYDELIAIEPSEKNYLSRAKGYVYILDYDMAMRDIDQVLHMGSKLDGNAIALLYTIQGQVSKAEYRRLLSLLKTVPEAIYFAPTPTPSAISLNPQLTPNP